MPLIGFTTSDVNKHALDRDFCFKLSQATKTLVFSAENAEQRARWTQVFNKCSRGIDVTRDDLFNKDVPKTDHVSSSTVIDNNDNIYEVIPEITNNRPVSSTSTVSDNSITSTTSSEATT